MTPTHTHERHSEAEQTPNGNNRVVDPAVDGPLHQRWQDEEHTDEQQEQRDLDPSRHAAIVPEPSPTPPFRSPKSRPQRESGNSL